MFGMTKPLTCALRSSWLNTLMDCPRVSRYDNGTPVRQYDTGSTPMKRKARHS